MGSRPVQATCRQYETRERFTISQGGGSASFSAQNGHADSNYAQVNEQAGINAGDGGFNVNVNGNTALTGAVISSTADASKNSLTTGTLTYTDIQNQSHYDATSNGMSVGAGVGATGKSVGPRSVSGSGGVSPMMSPNENGDSSSTTSSAVGAGTINITNASAQTQDVAGLSRDTTDTNGTVSKTPDVNALLSQQADTMQAAQAAGQAVAQGIGEYADMKRDAAVAQATIDATNGDTAAFAADVAEAKQWDEGGNSRAILQGAGGALIGGLGGGSIFTAVGGGLSAGLTSKLADQLDSLSKTVASETGSDLLGNLAANLAVGLGGALIGGTAGAATGTSVDLYNRQLDPKEQPLAQQLADASGGKYTVQQIEDQMAQMNLTANGQTESGGVRVAVGDQPNDGTIWTPYGVNQVGQQVWAQSLGAGDPNLQAFIVNGAQGSGLTYQATTTGSNPGLFRLPDFVNFQVDYFVGSVWGTFTRDGNAFFGTGINMALPNPVQASASITAGWLNQSSVAPGQTNNFAGGYAGGMSAAYGIFGAGIMNSPGNGTATVIGVGGGVSAGKNANIGGTGGGYSSDQGKTRMGW